MKRAVASRRNNLMEKPSSIDERIEEANKALADLKIPEPPKPDKGGGTRPGYGIKEDPFKGYDYSKPKPLSIFKKALTPTVYILKSLIPPEEFKLFIIYAGLGKGKSAYAIFSLVETLVNWYKIDELEAWEMVKTFIVFHPQQFFDKLDEIEAAGYSRIPGLIWDDAGLWLYALDWNEPFIKSFGKYLNIARTLLACMLMTTPAVKWIFSKVRDFPDAYTVSIMKTTGNPRAKWRREAKGYQSVILPDLKKSRVYQRFEDTFNCRMPDFFFEWYKPLRDAYELLARDLIKKNWAKLKEKESLPELEAYPGLALPPMRRST